MSHIIVGTAGHIDHGKTSLVKALTGIDTDRLKEEKARGITIDLGFASLRLDDRSTIGFVDVPGHERFVKNMLAGAGGIDAVMLVIAADESVMPQTREHLAICELLHVRQGLTVLTKIDVSDRDLADLVEVDVQDFLRGSFLEKGPLLRVSARTGEGMPALVEALRRLAETTPARDASQTFRLPIDRCFTMKGFGAVAAGTLIAGSVRRDDEVALLPAGKPARVRGIQVHGVAVDQARAGQRTALNLQRVELADLERGMVLTVPGVFQPSATFDVHLELLAAADKPLPSRKRIRFHVGTAELIGRVVLFGCDQLEPGHSAFARIRLEKPTFALPGDRFIIRQYSPMITLGGGEVLDPLPPRVRRRDPAVIARLRILRDGSAAEKVARLAADAGTAAVTEAALIGRLGLTPAVTGEAIRELERARAIRVVNRLPLTIAGADAFARAAAATGDVVRAFHAAEPLLPGIGREDLRARVFAGASADFFRAVLDDLASNEQLTIEQDIVRAFGRTTALQGADQQARERLLARFHEAGLQAPPPDELAAGAGVDRTAARKILQMLVKENLVVKITEGMLVERAALSKLIDDVRARKASNPRLGIGEFKELTGLSRKFAVPLLEYLDGQRVTRRIGDERVIL